MAEPLHDEDDTAVSKVDEHIDQQEDESFPASDPHSDWAGPSE
ncbi:MAG TPA: hypothetical protein VGG38_19600 [Acidimicrobiales bacterium]|jgi:hypothetical protein